MVYPTLRATVRDGKIQLLDDVPLPENTTLLVTVMAQSALDTLSLGERLVASLQDMLQGRCTEVKTQQALDEHLDSIFNEA